MELESPHAICIFIFCSSLLHFLYLCLCRFVFILFFSMLWMTTILLNEPEINDINIKLDFYFTFFSFLFLFFYFFYSLSLVLRLFLENNNLKSTVSATESTSKQFLMSVIKIDRPEPVLIMKKKWEQKISCYWYWLLNGYEMPLYYVLHY